ncbi:MAG TPA: ornithine cyclodeaminase family protein [Alphaproteobacteria bacterium]|jgi:ornithine cyclodeaminase
MADSAPHSFLWLTEADVVSLISLSGAIAALEAGLRLEAEGKARNLRKGQTAWEGGSLNVTGAQFTGAGFSGAKVWTNVGGRSAPLLLLHGSQDGQLKAIIEAVALGQMRTGALAGVATKWLAAEGADDMAIVGTGKQSLTQVAAVHAVRPLKRLRVFSPTAENRARFAAELRETYPFEVVEGGSVEDAVRDAPIVTTVTRARDPFLFSAMVAPGAHINAAGAIIPAFAEIAPDILPRCDRVVVDSIEGCREDSRELKAYYDEGKGNWDDVLPLCQVVAKGEKRPAGADLTLFKWMGMGLADLAAGIEIFRRARKRGVGREYPHPGRAPVDLS